MSEYISLAYLSNPVNDTSAAEWGESRAIMLEDAKAARRERLAAFILKVRAIRHPLFFSQL